MDYTLSMKYTMYAVLWLLLWILSWVVTPVLPLFSEIRNGPLNNNNLYGTGYRLRKFLSWFDTPDNSLDGDNNFIEATANWPRYLRHVRWLYRNSLYGLKWTVLSCNIPLTATFIHSGDPRVNRNNGVLGTFKAKYNEYWQYKVVKKLVGNWGIMWNFGWQLDEFIKEKKAGKALFQLSPRFTTIK
jgi:hypothetical protein